MLHSLEAFFPQNLLKKTLKRKKSLPFLVRGSRGRRGENAL